MLCQDQELTSNHSIYLINYSLCMPKSYDFELRSAPQGLKHWMKTTQFNEDHFYKSISK